jgi:uncharacterized protein with PIN domain
MMTSFSARIEFHGDLSFFLRRKSRPLERRLTERTSIKDVIEACGVPHTEVDLILVNGQPVDFSRVLDSESSIDAFPVDLTTVTTFPENRLQVRHLRKFVADGHLGKLVRDLRLLGVDVVHDRDADDHALVETASEENRALLTRDRRLLMHAAVRHGYYLRSQNPLEQTIEVLRRFDLMPDLSPFSRCLRCNAMLEPAEKEKIIGQLEPLTKIYYDQFRRCPKCRQVYWSGSHFEKLQARIQMIRSRMASKVVG